MRKTTVNLPGIKLIGITARTSNAKEMHPETAKIGGVMQEYFHNSVAEKILHRKTPNVTFCVYTEYESDANGAYTYFIGEEVDSFDEIAEGCKTLVIPAQTYTKFTTESGVMPEVVINAWQKIWQMTPVELMGNRAYIADFEVYDERALYPQDTAIDLYIVVVK